MQKFVILTTQRSGSTFFRLYLNSHKNIRCHDEVFSRGYGAMDGWDSFTKNKRKMNNEGNELQLFYDYLEELFYNQHHSAPWTDIDTWDDYLPQIKKRVKAVGFKFMYDQFREYPYFEEWLKSEKIKIIHFSRKNKLKMAISRNVARNSGIYHSQKVLVSRKINLDTTSVVDNIRKYSKLEKEFARLYRDENYLEIEYEKLLRFPGKENKRICKFLSIKEDSFHQPKLIKINPENINKIVCNFDELETALKKAGYSWMLRE